MRRSRHELTLVLLAAAVGLTGCVSVSPSGMSSALRENGVAAQATILAVWNTGSTVNGDPVVGMRVEVRAADRPAFEATIAKTLVSRVAVTQFQPGKDISVRYDPADPAVLAVDLEGFAPSPETSNPYRDHLVRAVAGTEFRSPDRPADVYLGTTDSIADDLALVESGYALLGTSTVSDGNGDLQQAIDEGKRIGAAIVVLYGHFDVAAGPPLELLPFGARPAEASAGAAPGQLWRAAHYYGRYPLPILGVGVRCLSDDQRASIMRNNGVFIVAVTSGSPAAAAHVQRGDILLAIDGNPVDDVFAVPAMLKSVAGRRVTIDLLREGLPVSEKVKLNPAR
jgi:hypothetical protein